MRGAMKLIIEVTLFSAVVEELIVFSDFIQFRFMNIMR